MATSPGEGVPGRVKIAVASLVGTAIEFYDFHICGPAAALVLNAAARRGGDDDPSAAVVWGLGMFPLMETRMVVLIGPTPAGAPAITGLGFGTTGALPAGAVQDRVPLQPRRRDSETGDQNL